jgi:hypothetical protein
LFRFGFGGVGGDIMELLGIFLEFPGNVLYIGRLRKNVSLWGSLEAPLKSKEFNQSTKISISIHQSPQKRERSHAIFFLKKI